MTKRDKQFNRSLPCPLTDREFEDRAMELAKALEDIARLEAEKKESATDFAEQIKGRTADARALRQVVKTREEFRDVKCHWVRDYKQKELRLMRVDTQKQVDSRTMTEAELQEELDFNKKTAAKGKKTPPKKKS